MADSSTRSVTINAASHSVAAVIIDYEHYPEWAGGITDVEVLEKFPDGRGKLVRFKLNAGIISDEYVLEYQYSEGRADTPGQIRWELVESRTQSAQHGSYTLEEADAGTTLVTYSLTVELKIPMLGIFKRKAERIIMETALEELRKRVEHA